MNIFTRICEVLGRLGLVLAAPAIVAILCYLLMSHYFLDPVDPSDTKKQILEISSGTNFRKICKNLEARGMLHHWRSLDLVARIKGEDKQIAAGEYELSASMSPREILAKLVAGDVIKRTIVFKEGQSIWELGKIVEEAGLMPALDFNRALTNPELLTQAGVEGKSFEGYLFPNTYFFSRPLKPRRIIWGLLEAAEKEWKPEYSQRAAELEMTRHEVLTLASIIEKESGNVEEQPLVSSVFHNRLKNEMKLQSDPTVVYGIPDFDGVITKKHLETPTPYNTYTFFGLPPGPICNPGAAAIKAALYPTENSQYLFFVADGKGGHVFTTTLQEHNKAVERYRTFLRIQKRRERIDQ